MRGGNVGVTQIRSYKDLFAWQKAMHLVEKGYRLTEAFPRSEEFGLKSQMRRAEVSIHSSVAEENVCHASKDYCRFLQSPSVPQRNIIHESWITDNSKAPPYTYIL